MRALIEAGFVMHNGELIHAYVPIRVGNDEEYNMSVDGLLHHVMHANVVADLTNRRYIKHRTTFPIPDVVSEDVVLLFRSVPTLTVDEIRLKERKWMS